jgi:hypothetical protein
MLHYRRLFEELVGVGGTDVTQDIVTEREVGLSPKREAERVATIEREEEEGLRR